MSRNWITGDDAEKLPERVRLAIRDQQDRSERLITYFQLSVLVVIGTFYFLSPKTFSDEAAFEPVPWALGIYLALTLIRLVWSARARLPAWSLAISVVFDMGLLMVLIWTFHIQYEQPASFYLKAPTILWIFIFIALRALRFDWRFVALSGAVAVVSWILMVLYVVFGDPDDMMVTRDYVTYLTSNSVLIGAEVEKILTISVVTAIIAYALITGADLAGSGCRRADRGRRSSRASSRRRSPPRSRARSGRSTPAPARCARPRSSTSTCAASPTSPPRPRRTRSCACLSEYQAQVVPVIQKHGGSIDKFLGDGIMATFGAAVADSTTYAADSLRALEETMAAAESWAELLRRWKAGSCPQGQRLGRHRQGALRRGRRRDPARVHGDRRCGQSLGQAGKTEQGTRRARRLRPDNLRPGGRTGLRGRQGP